MVFKKLSFVNDQNVTNLLLTFLLLYNISNLSYNFVMNLF